MHRFFVPSTWIAGEHARLEGDVARQVSRVLRMSPGDEVTLLDNSGNEYRMRLTRFSREVVEGVVLSIDEGRGEPSLKVTLYQGMLKGEKFLWVLQKGTELGVTAFVPLICHRSLPQERDSWLSARYPRWRKVVTEAAEQSGRCLLPDLKQPISFRDACEEIKGSRSISIIPWEREGASGLRSTLQESKGAQPYFPALVNIFIGPEGGFEEWEIDCARSCGVLPISLGRRILRSETAAIATVAAVMYEAGEIGRLNT